MALGFIDFLFGGRKKTKLPKSAQVSSPSLSSASNEETTEWYDISNDLPEGTEDPTFADSREENTLKTITSENPQTVSDSTHTPRGGHKKSLSEAIYKINTEIKESTERITEIVTDMKEVENKVIKLEHKVDSLEEHRIKTDEKLQKFDEHITKFSSLYELINNQYSPFADKNTIPQTNKIELDSQGNTISNESLSEEELQMLKEPSKTIDIKEASNIESTLLELETINIEEAAGDAVPLQHIKNNTNSLVIILSWLEFLIKRVGIDETRNTLRYYTETLRWITPDSYFELDKYLKGMKDKEITQDFQPINIRDHIVSLYFISKLNEKKLDDKLTNAVLHIIKQ